MGVLEKKGHMIKNWRSRHFRFDPTNRTLAYYENDANMQSKTEEKGTLTVTSICDVPDRPDSRPHRFDFLGYNARGELTTSVSAPSKVEKERWLATLGKIVGVQDASEHPRFRQRTGSMFSGGKSSLPNRASSSTVSDTRLNLSDAHYHQIVFSFRLLQLKDWKSLRVKVQWLAVPWLMPAPLPYEYPVVSVLFSVKVQSVAIPPYMPPPASRQ